MAILSEGYLTTQDLIKYVKEKHDRHWGKNYISVLIKRKNFPVVERIGKKNIFDCKDIDKHISTIQRPSSSGKRGIKYKV